MLKCSLAFLILTLDIFHSTYAHTLKGDVFLSKNNTYLYTEEHALKFNENLKNGSPKIESINTKYLNKSKVIGFREVSFVEHHYIPNSVFKDELRNETYSMTVNGPKAILRTYFNKKEKKIEFKIKPNMVLPSTLSKYIDDHFESLKKNVHVVECLMPRSLSFVKLKISPQEVTNSKIVFSVQPSSIFFRIFSDKTEITYSLLDKKWVSYSGYGYLKDKKGVLPLVRIEYNKL